MTTSLKRHVLDRFLEELWTRYLQRVEYARTYRDLVENRGGNAVNDHIAFRTINGPLGEGQSYPSGIEGISRVVTGLGYKPKADYKFSDKHLTATHFEHEDSSLPKIFVSQLEVAELDEVTQKHIIEATANAVDHWESFGDKLEGDALHARDEAKILENLLLFFFGNARPWSPPREETIRAVNEVSQYAAWTLLHGNSVNHFTAYVNNQNVGEWPDIDATVAGLRKAGVPMKEKVEGQPGSILRQSATQPVTEITAVVDSEGNHKWIKWPYAYYEIAERGLDENGNLFSGFLGAQATHLFEMTKGR